MSVVEELIRKEDNGTLSFGNYLLDAKTKKADFEFQGDLYKVKTFKEITKLEKNGSFVYESVPGSAVTDFKNDGEVISFRVEAAVELGKMKTNLGGKLNVSIELDEGKKASVKVIKC